MPNKRLISIVVFGRITTHYRTHLQTKSPIIILISLGWVTSLSIGSPVVGLPPVSSGQACFAAMK